MTTLIQQLLEMQIRMNELASGEQSLIKDLSDTVAHADELLLRQVRNLAAEHEDRRGDILEELRLLSSRLGKFPNPHHATLELPQSDSSQPACGDWRLAAANIRDEHDLCADHRLAAS